MKDPYDLLDEFAQHAPPRPSNYNPHVLPDLERDQSPQDRAEQVRDWLVNNDAAWRWHFAVEMMKQRAMAREALSYAIKQARGVLND